MNVPALKISRLVNKTWKAEVDKEIEYRDCFRLKFDPKTRPLKEGLKELEFSQDLPCFDFHLSIAPNQGLREIHQFISLFGPRVKSLTLNSEMHKTSLLIIFTGVPNLEKLFFSGTKSKAMAFKSRTPASHWTPGSPCFGNRAGRPCWRMRPWCRAPSAASRCRT